MYDVNLSPAFKWIVILLIPLTFGSKLVNEGQTADESEINIVEFLSRHKFDITKRIVADIPVIDATAGACRMSVVEASPDGWMRDFIHDILGTTEHQFTVFRGNIYPEQPTWLTLTDHWWSKSLRKLGLARREALVIAVSAFRVRAMPSVCRGTSSPPNDVWASLLKEPDGRHVGETVPNRDFVPRFA